MMQKFILVVENEPEWSGLIKEYFKEEYSIESADSKAVAVDWLQRRRFDLVLTNLHLLPHTSLGVYPGGDFLGARVIAAVHQYAPGTPCIVISGHPHLVVKHLGEYPEWVDVFYKGDLRWDELANTIKQVIEERHKTEANLKNSSSRVGKIFRHLTEDPIKGTEALIEDLKDVPELSQRIPDLGVRLNILKKIESQREAIGMLTDTEEAERRLAVHFAIGVCLEFEEIDKAKLGEPA